MKKFNWQLLVIFFIPIYIFFFYLFYINLSTDTIILFLAQKIFLGNWLLKGILPLFNPHIFLGVPFAFDVGMGNLHPLNLVFMFPYPLSFALWAGLTTLLFLGGFYLFFLLVSKQKTTSLLLTLVLFFSGSGFIRLNNPTIFAVIAHYGIFLYSLSYLKKKNGYWFPLLIGILMTLAGHLQFVIYGYLLGFIISTLHYKTSFKKNIVYFSSLLLLTGWYYILSLPNVLESTRLGVGKDYADIGPIRPLQFVELILPFFLGYIQTGATWNVGTTAVILLSLLPLVLFLRLIIDKKVQVKYLGVLFICFVLSLGVVTIPFFRGAGQIWVVIHIVLLTILSKQKEILGVLFQKKQHFLYLILSVIFFFLFLFFISPFFSTFLVNVYMFLKHKPMSLFFDKETIAAVGLLIGKSFIPLGLFFVTLYFGSKNKKYAVLVLFCFVIIEGLIVNYYHGYFVPSNVLKQKVSFQPTVDRKNYRIQSTLDVIPYSGFHTYMGSILMRPPFSKEISIIDQNEERNYDILRSIFKAFPTSWAMVAETNSIQGYNTFVPKKLAEYFSSYSQDYTTEYNYIITRNAEFVGKPTTSHINAIDTSHITMNDPRWQELGVRYFISDRPLKKYTLISQEGNKFIYENKNAPSIYRLIDISNKETMIKSIYVDPNQMQFDIKNEDIGKKLVIIINPAGFEAEQNGRKVKIEKKEFNLIIPLSESGILKVYYSPLYHLTEVLRKE